MTLRLIVASFLISQAVPTAAPSGMVRASNFFGAAPTPPGLTLVGTGDVQNRPGTVRQNATTQVEDVPSTEASFSTADDCGDIEARVQHATGDLAAATAAVHAAQCILSRRCAGPLSAELAESDSRRGELAGAASAALALLDRASQHLLEGEGEANTKRELADRIQSLRAFGSVFAALARAGQGESSHRQLLDACKELAPCLDDSAAELVESTKLWLSLAYRRAGRPDRALQIARPVIAAPTSRRIGFLLRLQRCRALGETGNHAAGIALCQRLAVRVDAWLAEEDESTRARAADTVRFIRMELLRGWAGELRRQGEDERADAAEAEAKKLRGLDGDWPPRDRWLALEDAIAGLPEEPASATSAGAAE